MRKFTPVALLLGMLSALLLGVVGVAHAGTLDYQCDQVLGANVVMCSEVTEQVTVKIRGSRVLTHNELSKLEDALNNTVVDVHLIQDVVIRLYKSFNPPIVIITSDIDGQIGSDWRYVASYYTARECVAAGNDGINKRLWTYYECRDGSMTSNYKLWVK